MIQPTERDSTAFQVASPFQPAGHQPDAIRDVAQRLQNGVPHQTILGVTGSGKTYVMAKVIEAVNRPALVLSHNKTLTAQLFHELRGFFPNHAVEYFVSYYDYYQPEAYIASSGVYIEKDSKINEEIDRLRHRATAALFTRRDVIVVASISCIYGLGSPEAYEKLSVHLIKGQPTDRDQVIEMLVEIQYSRNDMAPSRGRFRARGDTLEVFPISADTALRLEFFGEELEQIEEFDILTNKVLRTLDSVTIFPAQHYVTLPERRKEAMVNIERELEERVRFFKEQGKAIEAQRIYERTSYDLEMMREIGYCQGIENYSRHLTGREPGSAPDTLLHYLPKDAILFLDESHVSLPQVQGMQRGDRSRKESLVDYGFRLPSAFDNRPLTFPEFQSIPNQRVYVSATPGPMERELCHGEVAELIVRPTGLVDPHIEIRPLTHQVDDLMGEINKRAAVGERTLVTTLTKAMAEELSTYLADSGLKVRYLHSEITTLERTEIIRELRQGKFDALVGINLLREGLDIPECSLVAVLDADKEGFLRSTTSLIQTCGRAARNINGTVILYADVRTDSINAALSECDRRRLIQLAFNETHGITPKGITKSIPESMRALAKDEAETTEAVDLLADFNGSPVEIPFFVARLREQISRAIAEERFEDAIPLRDKVYALESEMKAMEEGGVTMRRVGESPRKKKSNIGPSSTGRPRRGGRPS